MTQRTPELGLRVALGAQRMDVRRLVFREGMGLASVGILVGLAISLGSVHAIRGLLFGVQPMDPITLGGAASCLLVIAALACQVPATRAMRVGPLVALRSD